MFGRSDNDQNAQASTPEPNVTAPTVEPSASATDPSTDTSAAAPTDTPAADTVAPASDAPAADTSDAAPAEDVPFTLPSVQTDTPTDTPAAALATAPTAAASSSPQDLLTMKQEALQHLQPLVGHLNQTPEEEFRTLMMMIQASDDQALLKQAYDAAQKIGDDKVRAQALLDVINEINYFTQQHAA